MPGRSLPITAAACALAAILMASPTRAEVNEIRLAKQFSMGYVQFNILEHRGLIEQHAKALGLGDVKVVWATFNGPNAMNDALVSGSVDVVSGGVPGLVTLWAKTKGTAQEVRGIAALSSQPFLLNTRNPAIKTVRDFTDADKIALPAVKVSVQAVTLEMAVAKEFGKESYAKLDHLTLSLAPPDATIGLLSGGSEYNSAFSVPPFQNQQLAQPGIHTVLNSFDVLGGSHSFTVACLNADKRAAAALWIEDAKSKLPLDMVEAILAGPQVKWTLTPENTMKYADFMAEVGSIKAKPDSWRDLFFPEIHDLPGS